jgi:hypothetical protein
MRTRPHPSWEFLNGMGARRGVTDGPAERPAPPSFDWVGSVPGTVATRGSTDTESSALATAEVLRNPRDANRRRRLRPDATVRDDTGAA